MTSTPAPSRVRTLIAIVVAIAVAVGIRFLPIAVLGAFVVGIGLLGFWQAWKLTPERQAGLDRGYRGPGGRLNQRLAHMPLRRARLSYAALGVFFVALGTAMPLLNR